MATELLPRSGSHPVHIPLLCFPRMRTSAPIQSRSRSHHQYMIQYTDRVHHRVPPSLPNDCGDLCTQHCPHSTASTDCLHSTAAHCPHSAAPRACSPCSMRVTCTLAPSFPSQLNQSFENGKNGPRGTAHAQPKKESEVNPAPDVIPTRGLYAAVTTVALPVPRLG